MNLITSSVSKDTKAPFYTGKTYGIPLKTKDVTTFVTPFGQFNRLTNADQSSISFYRLRNNFIKNEILDIVN